jgi:tetratricopeptide (TPR) repeat protein
MRSLKYIFLIVLLAYANFALAQDRNLLPKYGELPRLEWQKAADEAFLRATDEEYHGDRKKASSDTALRGWQYLRGGDRDNAMRRFNQAWLLNPNNGTALWGMAAVVADAGRFDKSLKLFSEAENSVGDQVNFSIDYARVVGIAGVATKDEALLTDAFERFARIYAMAPANVRNLQNWAVTLYGVGKYSEAWEKIKLAETTPDRDQLDREFLKSLQSRMPRPKD